MPNSSFPLLAALNAMPTTRMSVVNTAPLFLPNLSEIYPDPNMPTIMPMMKAFERREYIVVERSGYKTPKMRDKLPIIDALKPSEPMARPEKTTMRVTESLE
jgi:hypothetical protein